MSSPSPPCATQLTDQPLLPSSVRLSAIALTRPASAPVRDRTDALDAADNTTAAHWLRCSRVPVPHLRLHCSH